MEISKLQEVNETIKELESKELSFDSCQKLAALYIIQDYNSKVTPTDIVVSEFQDILPAYNNYKTIKTQYQLNNTTSDKVIHQMELVCKEIEEFIQTLYSTTDLPKERELLKSTIKNLNNL